MGYRSHLAPVLLLVLLLAACRSEPAPQLVLLEGEPFEVDAVMATATREAGGLFVRISASDYGDEGTADEGLSIIVDLMLDETALVEGQSIIEGSVSFGPWTDSRDTDPTDEATFEAAPGNATEILSVVAWASCFCTPATRSASQQLSGTLRLSRVSAAELEGVLTLDITAALPFYRSGNETDGAHIEQLPFTASIDAAP